MKIIKPQEIFFIKDLNICTNFGSGLYIFDSTHTNIELQDVISGEDNFLQECANFSSSKNCTLIVFINATSYGKDCKLGAFVFDRGVFFSMYEKDYLKQSKKVTVFDTYFGLVGILMQEEVYQSKVFYYFESLGVDYLVVYGGAEEQKYIQANNHYLPCVIFKDEDFYLHNI